MEVNNYKTHKSYRLQNFNTYKLTKVIFQYYVKTKEM